LSFPQSRFAYADVRKPKAWGCCDRCGFRYFRDRLSWQFDYRGLDLQNLRILVDHRCLDLPQPQLRPILISADPVPIRDPRPGYAQSQQGYTPVFDVLDIVDGDLLPPPPNHSPIIPPTNLLNDGGLLYLIGPNTYPVDSTGLAAGAVYNVGGGNLIGIVPGVTPNHAAPPVVFGSITASQLLVLGGGNLPLAGSPLLLNQLYNLGDLVCVSPSNTFGDFLTDDLGRLITDDLGNPIPLDASSGFLTDAQGNVITDDLGNPVPLT